MRENLSSGFGNKGADQTVHPHSLISIFIICYLESIIFRLTTSNISIFWLVSVAETFFKSKFVGNPEDRFCRLEACMNNLTLNLLRCSIPLTIWDPKDNNLCGVIFWFFRLTLSCPSVLIWTRRSPGRRCCKYWYSVPSEANSTMINQGSEKKTKRVSACQNK